jgi:hypothetical protein
MAGPVRLCFRPEQRDEPVPAHAGRRGRNQGKETEPMALSGTPLNPGALSLERHAAEEPERGMHDG